MMSEKKSGVLRAAEMSTSLSLREVVDGNLKILNLAETQGFER